MPFLFFKGNREIRIPICGEHTFGCNKVLSMATNIMYNINRRGGRSDRKNLVYDESLECFLP